MNPLPEAWMRAKAAAPQSHELVLVDGAMQHELGKELAADPHGAMPLLADVEPAAQALGPWLMTSDIARELGIDGAARGVNWLLSRMPLAAAHAHLVPWVAGPLPDGTPRGYVRVADSRTLRALVPIWTAEQRAAFFLPWIAWCYADRDGAGALVTLPTSKPDHDAAAYEPSPLLDQTQFERLNEASLPDQLLHQAKGLVAPHAACLASRELRHHVATTLIGYASAIGYDDVDDQFTLLLWVLRVGVEERRKLSDQPAVRERLKGDALWKALLGSGTA